MHGNIDQPVGGRDTGFSYRTRAAMLDDCRRLGNGVIDYDYYRARARTLRSVARQRFVCQVARFVLRKLRIASKAGFRRTGAVIAVAQTTRAISG